jgi:amidohydrolase
LSEDFSRFAHKVPALFVVLGVTPPTKDLRTAALFEADEAAPLVGVKVMSELAFDYLSNGR